MHLSNTKWGGGGGKDMKLNFIPIYRTTVMLGTVEVCKSSQTIS